MIADTLVCIDTTSHHSAEIRSTAMGNRDFWLTLEPGDCYQTSNQERVKLRIANPYRVDGNGDGKYAKTVHKAGTYAVKAKTTPRTVVIRVR